MRSESALAIDPRDPDRILEVYQTLSSVSSHYALAAYASCDGGRSWKQGAPPALPSGATGLTDPAALWDLAGHVHLLAVALAPGDPPAMGAMLAYRSPDGGLTWEAPRILDARPALHQPFLAADVNPDSPHHGRVYAAWCAGGSLGVARNDGSGGEWQAVQTFENGCFCPEILTAPDGAVHILWMAGQAGSQIHLITSTDGGQSFGTTTSVVKGITSLRGALPENLGFPHFPDADFRVLTVATGCTTVRGTVLIAWADARLGPTRIYYRHSRDGARTWKGPASGQPLLTGSLASAPNQQEFLPRLLSTPEGEICCAFYEYGPKAGRDIELVDLILATSANDGDLFDSRMIVTEEAWDPKQDAPSRRGSGRGSMSWLSGES